MVTYFWIAVGSALGAIGRYWCSGVVTRWLGETFPWGTFFVNMPGLFHHRIFCHLDRPRWTEFSSAPTARQFVMIGICGGYTTFSAFSLQTLYLMNDGEWLYAGGNIVISVVACLLAVWVGHVLALTLNAMRWV